MEKFLNKVAIIGSIVIAGITMTGCTDFERGFVTGAAVGAGTTGAVYEGSRSHTTRSRSKGYYNVGYRNGCSSVRGRWYKNSYKWRNFSSYRDGWRAGYRRCR